MKGQPREGRERQCLVILHTSRPVTEGRHTPLAQKGVENLVRVSRWRDTREEPECHREKRRQDMVERLQRTSTKDRERWGG